MAHCLVTPWLDTVKLKYSHPSSNTVRGTYHEVLGKMELRKLLSGKQELRKCGHLRTPCPNRLKFTHFSTPTYHKILKQIWLFSVLVITFSHVQSNCAVQYCIFRVYHTLLAISITYECDVFRIGYSSVISIAANEFYSAFIGNPLFRSYPLLLKRIINLCKDRKRSTPLGFLKVSLRVMPCSFSEHQNHFSS